MSLFKEEQLKDIPELYAQDGKGDKAVVHLRVNLGSNFNWLITEFSPEESLFFGFVCLNGDVESAELGYISKTELEDLSKKYFLEVEKVNISLKEAKEKWIY
jgi:hypothetical protein